MITPLYFGSSIEPLFGTHFSPAPENENGKGIIICQSIWQEYIRAHWACGQIARALAKSGFHVLLFDYYSTGDSSGKSGLATFDRMSDDIATAFEELFDNTGISDIGLIGIRAGCTLVAQCCRKHHLAPFAAAYWDPVICGKDYIDQITLLHKRIELPEDSNSLVGFPVTEKQIQSILNSDEHSWFENQNTPHIVVFSQKEQMNAWNSGKLGKTEGFAESVFIENEGDWLNTKYFDKILMLRQLPEKLVSFFSQRIG